MRLRIAIALQRLLGGLYCLDRVVSIEMFEHMKNYEALMAKVSRALKPGGKLFLHIFAHKESPYDFEEGWMSEHFFTGGTMPSADLLHFFQRDLTLRRQWWVSGKHYAQTCEDWLKKMNGSKDVWEGLEETYAGNKKWEGMPKRAMEGVEEWLKKAGGKK